jgi:hypothetical protein
MPVPGSTPGQASTVGGFDSRLMASGVWCPASGEPESLRTGMDISPDDKKVRSMQLKIHAPFAGWRIIPEHEADRVHGYPVEVDVATAARGQVALKAYDLVQAEMQAAASAELLLEKRGN